MGWITDPTTGKQVYVDDKTGKAQLRSREGGIVEVDPARVGDVLIGTGGYAPATPDEVRVYDVQKEAGVGDRLRVAGESAARAGVDILTTPIQIGARAAGDERMAENLRGSNVVARTIAPGGFGVDAEREKERMRLEAEAMPGEALVGQVGAEVAATALLPGSVALRGASRGAQAAATVGRFAAEGGYLGAAQASEAAFLEDTELTAEKVLAHAGPAALIGGLVGVAPAGLQAATRRRPAPAGLAPDAPPALPAPDGTGLPYRASAEELSEQAGKLVDRPTPGLWEKVRGATEDLQARATGTDPDTLRRFGGLNLSDDAKRGREIWRRKEELLEESTREITEDTSALVGRSDEVQRVVVSPEAKADVVRRNLAALTPEQQAKALTDARTSYAQLRADIASLTAGTRAAREGAETGAKKVSRRSGDKFLDDLNQWTAQVDGALQKGDAAEAYIALDRTKRAMQKKVDNLGTTMHRETNPLRLERKQAQLARLEETQERVRQFLMSEDIWGAQGAAQRQANAAWERYLNVSRNFEKKFTQRMGRQYGGAGGRPINEVDPDRIGSYVRRLGRQQGALDDQVFREYVDATEGLTRAIGDGYDVGDAGRKALSSVQQSASKIKGTLAKADETIRVANQIDEVIQRSAGGSLLDRGLLGGLIGGAPGAALGAGVSIVQSPGALIRHVAAAEAMADKFDGRMTRALKRFFGREKGARPARAATPGKRRGRVSQALATTERRGKKLARAAAVPAALRMFRGDHSNDQDAYRARVREVISANADGGAAIRHAMTERLGELATEAPSLYQQLVAQSTKAAAYLAQQIPAGVASPTPLQPHRQLPVPKHQVRKFAKIWAAIQDPATVVEDLESGQITMAQVDALRAVYPRVYQEMQQATLAMIRERSIEGEDPLPYNRRLRLDILLSLNGAGEPTMSRDFAGRLDALRAEQAEKQKPPAPSRMPPPKVADNRLSPMQELET